MKKIAIASDGHQVSAHFGRCPSFTIFKTEDKGIVHKEVINNPGHRTGYLPGFLQEKGVSTIICGGMGRRAISLFREKGIQVIVGITGDIDQVISDFLQEKLQQGDSLCEPGGGKGYGLDKEDHH